MNSRTKQSSVEGFSSSQTNLVGFSADVYDYDIFADYFNAYLVEGLDIQSFPSLKMETVCSEARCVRELQN